MIPPLIKGGQGRTESDIRRTASGMVWTWFALAACLVALWGASS